MICWYTVWGLLAQAAVCILLASVICCECVAATGEETHSSHGVQAIHVMPYHSTLWECMLKTDGVRSKPASDDCGSEANPCVSLEDAFAAAENFKSLGRPASSSLNGHAKTRIFLNASRHRGNCHVLLYSMPCESEIVDQLNTSDVKERNVVGLNIANALEVEIQGRNDAGSCPQSILVHPYYKRLITTRDMEVKYMMTLVNSSMITFSNVRFDSRHHDSNTTHSAKYIVAMTQPHEGLMQVLNCRMIKFFHCAFHSIRRFGVKEIKRKRTVYLSQSSFVMFANCSFVVRNYPFAQKATSAVQVHFHGEMKWSNELTEQQEEEAITNFYSTKEHCSAPESCSDPASSYSTSTWLQQDPTAQPPAVVFLACTFTGCRPNESTVDYDPLKTVQRVLSVGDYMPAATIYVRLASSFGYRVILQQCLFRDNSSPSGTTALFDFHVNVSSTDNCLKSPANGLNSSAVVQLVNCTFVNNTAFSGGAFLVNFSRNTSPTFRYAPERCGNRLEVLGGEYLQNSATSHGAAITVRNAGLNNQVVINGATFAGNKATTGNSAQPGGAIAVMVDSKKLAAIISKGDSPELKKSNSSFCQRAPICLDSADFKHNFGWGCIHLTSTGAVFTGETFVDGGSESAFVLTSSEVRFSGRLLVRNNTGFKGGVFHVRGRSAVDLSEVEYMEVSGNSAYDAGTVAYIDLDQQREQPPFPARQQERSCAFIFPKNFATKAKQMKMFFSDNKGALSDRRISVIYITTLVPCLNVESASFRSVIHAAYDFEDPWFCLPYAPSLDPVFRLQEDICRGDFCNVIQSYSSPDGPFPESCGLLNNSTTPARASCNSFTVPEGNCSTPDLGAVTNSSSCNVTSIPPTSMTVAAFKNFSTLCIGRGRMGGSAIQIWKIIDSNGTKHRCSLKSTNRHTLGPANTTRSSILTARGVCSSNKEQCSHPNSYMYQPRKQCFSQSQQLYVVNERYTTACHCVKKLTPFGTSTAWVIFSTASTSCYKPVGDNIWYFYLSCDYKDIYEYLHKSPYRVPLFTDHRLEKLASWHLRHNTTVPPILPGYLLTLVPWASSAMSWNHPAVGEEESTQNYEWFRATPNRSISDLTLHPAPGEEFDLRVSTLGEFLRPTSTSMWLSVISNDVLLSHNDYIFKPGRSELFRSEDRMQKLSLYGYPESEGFLKIVVKEERVPSYWQRSGIELLIPFRLRRCHLGFRNMTPDTQHARWLIDNFHQAYTENVTLFWKNRIQEDMGCQCRNDTTKDSSGKCVDRCDSGKHVHIKWRCWAGLRNDTPVDNNISQSYNIPKKFLQTSEKFFAHYRGDPVGMLDQNLNEFAADECTMPSCSLHGGRSWLLRHDNPCTNESNKRGPLCSACNPDYKYTIEKPMCIKCSEMPTVHLSVYFLLLFAALGVWFIILLFLNVGITAPLESWLFFCQVYYCIHGENSVTRSIYTSVITLGLGWLCVTDDLPSLLRQTTMIAPPLMSLLWLAIYNAVVSRGVALRFFQKLQRRNSIRHVLWLVILASTVIQTHTALHLIRCVTLGDDSVVYIDARVLCFSSDHAPYVAVSFLILTIFVLPVPVLLIWKPIHRWPSLKGLLDEATHIYEDGYSWWASFNIIRRIVYGMVLSLETNGLYRRAGLAVLTVIQLALHGYFRPFQRSVTLWRVKDVYNSLEFLLLLSLCILGGYRQLQVDVNHGPSTGSNAIPITIFCIMSCLALGLYIYEFIISWRNTIQKRPRQTLSSLWSQQDSNEDDDDDDDDEDGNDDPTGENCSAKDDDGHCSASVDLANGTALFLKPCSAKDGKGSRDETKSKSKIFFGEDEELKSTSLREPFLMATLVRHGKTA